MTTTQPKPKWPTVGDLLISILHQHQQQLDEHDSTIEELLAEPIPAPEPDELPMSDMEMLDCMDWTERAYIRNITMDRKASSRASWEEMNTIEPCQNILAKLPGGDIEFRDFRYAITNRGQVYGLVKGTYDRKRLAAGLPPLESLAIVVTKASVPILWHAMSLTVVGEDLWLTVAKGSFRITERLAVKLVHRLRSQLAPSEKRTIRRASSCLDGMWQIARKLSPAKSRVVVTPAKPLPRLTREWCAEANRRLEIEHTVYELERKSLDVVDSGLRYLPDDDGNIVAVASSLAFKERESLDPQTMAYLAWTGDLQAGRLDDEEDGEILLPWEAGPGDNRSYIRQEAYTIDTSAEAYKDQLESLWDRTLGIKQHQLKVQMALGKIDLGTARAIMRATVADYTEAVEAYEEELVGRQTQPWLWQD